MNDYFVMMAFQGVKRKLDWVNREAWKLEKVDYSDAPHKKNECEVTYAELPCCA